MMPSSQKLKKIKTTNITANSFFPLEMNTRSIKDSRWLVVGAVCSDSYDTFDVRMCDDKNGGVLLLPTCCGCVRARMCTKVSSLQESKGIPRGHGRGERISPFQKESQLPSSLSCTRLGRLADGKLHRTCHM